MRGYKYAVLGVGILVVEAPDHGEELPTLARRLSHPDYGVGSATVAFLYPANSLKAEPSNENRTVASPASLLAGSAINRPTADIAVRAFLPSGQELAFSAAGCVAAADYLFITHGRQEAWIGMGNPLVPTEPRYAYRDKHGQNVTYHIAIGRVVHMPDRFAGPLYRLLASPMSNGSPIDVVYPIITLNDDVLRLRVYCTYIGEPHAICFVDEQDSSDVLIDIFEQPDAVQEHLFGSIVAQLGGPPLGTRIETIYPGSTLGPQAALFDPVEGVNITFARLAVADTIDARFYQRGTYREVHFSGSAAAATAAVAEQARRLSKPLARVRGWLNSRDGHDGVAYTQRNSEMWWIDLPLTSVCEFVWSDGAA